MSNENENVEIVASFPLPPKQFYDHLTEEEILQMEPPPIDRENVVVFGFEQKLIISDKTDLMLSDELINELKSKKMEIFNNFKRLLDGIEVLQDSLKVDEAINSIVEPFHHVFDITSKLATIQAAVSLEKSILEDFEQINTFINS